MIVITGAGRCGTSLIARVYAEAGDDPGGKWHDAVDAGYEDPEGVRLNRILLGELGASLLGRQRPLPRPEDLRRGGDAAAKVRDLLSEAQKERIRRVNNAMPWNRPGSLKTIDWELADEVVERHRSEMVRFASQRSVVKDPQFALTLPLWLAAGAEITHVVALTRAVSSMLESRGSGGMMGYRRAADARNALLIANGTMLSTLADHPDVAQTHLRFPDLLEDVQTTARRLPTTELATTARLQTAIAAIVDRSKVHS